MVWNQFGLADSYSPSSMWSFFSMLKSTIQQYHNVNIDYPRLTSFLKKNGAGFVQKKSNVFLPEHILKFLKEAPDETYLDLKVKLILLSIL